MKPSRSIRTKLITLYVTLLTAVFFCFGAYVYLGFKTYLIGALQRTLTRRAHQVAATILSELPARGPSYVASETQARYAPELNERVIRIIDANGKVIYASSNADVLSPATPGTIPPQGTAEAAPVFREETPAQGPRLRVVSLGYRLDNGATYTVEVGAPENDISEALDRLLTTLAIGIVILIGVALAGGYSLLGRALRPVDQIVGSAERITLKNLDQRLPVPQTGDEFERISLALNRMIARLDEAFQIANQFTLDASHEIRTPLTVIRGELEVLANAPYLDPETADQAGNILEEVDRLTRIVEGLLLVSRLDGGEAQMKPKPVDLGGVVNATADQMELLSKNKLLTVHREIHDDVCVEADSVRLKQIIVNLLDNAIKYTPEGGDIFLKVRARAHKAVFEIADTGIGISQDALPRIFNRFFRSEEAKASRLGGTGLGLAIVQSITEAHGGTISVESDENCGAKFRLELPLLESPKTTAKKTRTEAAV